MPLTVVQFLGAPLANTAGDLAQGVGAQFTAVVLQHPARHFVKALTGIPVPPCAKLAPCLVVDLAPHFLFVVLLVKVFLDLLNRYRLFRVSTRRQVEGQVCAVIESGCVIDTKQPIQRVVIRPSIDIKMYRELEAEAERETRTLALQLEKILRDRYEGGEKNGA